MRSGLFALVLGLACVAACPAAAQTLAQADEAFGQGDIEAASRGYQQALASGALSGEGLTRAYLRAGVLGMWMGDTEESERLLRWALTLDPDLGPPPELSPAQQRAFRALRAEVANAPLLSIEVAPAGRSARVSVSAPALSGLRVRATTTAEGVSEPHSQIREAAETFEVAVPASAWGAALRADVEVALLDPYGNTLRTDRAVIRRVSEPAAASPEPGDAPAAALEVTDDQDDGGDDTGLIIGVTLAVVAALAGAAFAVGYVIWDQTPETFNLVRGP